MRLMPTVALLAALLAACGSADAGSGNEAVVRDSAGVTIVENPSLGEGPTLGWSLGASASLAIGALDGPEEYQLFRVRHALRLPDGRIAVVNSGSGELRVYAADGSYLSSFGGRGEGPGEFLQPGAVVAWPTDSLAVWDWRQRRITVLGRDGTLGRTFTLNAGDGDFPTFSHVTEAGGVVFATQGFPTGPPETGLHRNRMTVTIFDTEGAEASALGEFPGDEVFMKVGDGTLDVVLLPFNRRTVVAPAGPEIIVSSIEHFELRYFTGEGVLTRIVRLAEPRHAVTNADREAELQRRLADATVEVAPSVRAAYNETPLPDTLPAFSDVVEDAMGYHWVRIYRAPSDTGPDRWAVLDPQGVLLGSLELPESFDVYEIGPDYILGLATDELDVEYVQMWPLERGLSDRG